MATKNKRTKKSFRGIADLKQLRKKFDLKEMVSRMPRNYKVGEESFGKPTGKEVW